MKFKPFKMAKIGADFKALTHDDDEPLNLHSSNPTPLSWHELTEILGHNPLSGIESSSLGYASTQGSHELRQIIAHQYHGSDLSADDVVLTSGAQEGIFSVMHALLGPGDQVIGFTPCFEPLYANALQAGADVSLIPLNESQEWQINWHQLENIINQNTKLLVINFPHNPTGAHISPEELTRLIKLCKKHSCWLFSDEVFRGLEHVQQHRLTAAADLYEKAISMGVMSKSLALPGIRLGWLTTRDRQLRQSIMNVKSHLSICQSSIDTHLCQTIIPHSKKIWQRNCKVIIENKKWLNKKLSQHDELYWQQPIAAATGFIQFKSLSAKDVITQWAIKYNLMVMPNNAFMTSHEGFRITLGLAESSQFYEKIMAIKSTNFMPHL